MTGRRWILSLFFMSALVVVACDDDSKTTITAPIQEWVWIAGSKIGSPMGFYGIKGTPDPANAPGARLLAMAWVDSSQNFWVFGGNGNDSTGVGGELNDLWRYDGTDWTWMGGANLRNQPGVYGTQGVLDPSNQPGSRCAATFATDSTGAMWMFGGAGQDEVGPVSALNDLWKFVP